MMDYYSLQEMVSSGSLLNRIAACAAMEGETTDPYGWAQAHRWKIIGRADWLQNWKYAKDTETVNANPDTGARTDVINDDMILSAVQAVRAQESPSA